MAIASKIISFWKQVRLRSSDMFTLFKVGIGVKSPTHKLHIKDIEDPVKLEGVQSDTSSSTKFLVLDGDDIVKHSTGTAKTTEEVQDIVGAMFTSNTETGVAVTYEDSDGTIDLVVDHDAATNFVAEEHYRWDTDIASTATIHTNNITDLHGAGVDGSANQLLTDDGDGTVTSESSLSYDSDILTIGTDNVNTFRIKRAARSDNNGARLYIEAGDAGGTDKVGGDLQLIAGRSTGNAAGGSIIFQSSITGSSGSSLNGLNDVVVIDSVGNLQIDGGLTTGSTSAINSSGLIQVANQSNITGVGTISSGTWQGTAIASAYLDSDTMHLSVQQTVSGIKTFSSTIIQDGDRTATPGSDGIAIHIDASDITNGDTSASGTAATFNHITFENPRLLATNSSVTTTNASTLFIKGAPVAHTNQTITNAWALRVAGGNSYFGGIITVAGNEIKDDDGTTCITFDSSGNTTIAGTTSGTFSGNLTGNASGSSGSCTGNAATATALTSGNKTIDGDLTIDGNNITNNASAANFNIASSRVLELQHAGAYDIQLGNSTNADVLKVQGNSEVVTVNGALNVTGQVDATLGNKYTKTGNTDGTYQGDVVYFGGTTSMTIGKIYHYKSDGTWEIVNADAVSTCDGLLGVALGAASDTNGMLLRGMVTLDHDPGAVGDVLYVQSDNAGTPGEATATAPSASGDCVRVVGYCLDASNGQIWFNPDNTFVEVA